MRTISLLTFASLFGLVKPGPEVSVFADHLLDMVNKDDGMDFYKYIKPTNYTTEFNNLNERYADGNIVGSDAFKTMEQIANENGFKVETHQVITSDGYILGIWRIPGSLKEEETGEVKPPVLLQHGLESDMMQWVFNYPKVAPAFVLARAGYDVWLGNNRGNRFSLTHTTLDPKSFEFWQFDWEDMGTKDTPAVIDFILKETGES